jgi:hypothetical protein
MIVPVEWDGDNPSYDDSYSQERDPVLTPYNIVVFTQQLYVLLLMDSNILFNVVFTFLFVFVSASLFKYFRNTVIVLNYVYSSKIPSRDYPMTLKGQGALVITFKILCRHLL